MAKYPPACFVNMKLHGMMLPAVSLAVRTPTPAPVGALAATLKLLIVIVMDLSAAQFVRKRKHRLPASGYGHTSSGCKSGNRRQDNV
jgi:hypothetical protein